MRDIKKFITTCTRDCPNTCGLEATVENGRIIRLKGSKKHPLTRGWPVTRRPKYIDRVYSKDESQSHDAWRVRLARGLLG